MADHETEQERVFGGRYLARRLIRSAESVDTYFGVDLHTQAEVVIKTIPAQILSPAAAARLEFEVAALNQLNLPNVAAAATLQLGSSGTLVYLARPFVAGVVLADRLRDKPLTPHETVQVGLGILTILRYSHQHGVLHRDVKPSNVVLDGTAPPFGGAAGRGQAPTVDTTSTHPRLVDFCIARHAWLSASSHELPARTALYLSPEQAGLVDSALDARADLYSVGVTLYECLAQRPPFEGDDIGEILRGHLSTRPPPLASRVPELPRALDQVIERLLRKDPRDRYQTAEGVLADLEEIAAAFANNANLAEFVVGGHDRRRLLTEPAFIGRAAELARLEAALAETRLGRGGLTLVESESGLGKTWLMVELRRRAMHSGLWVLHGQGLDQVAQRPYEVLSGVVREIVAAAASAPDLRRSLVERLSPLADDLHPLFPELGRMLGASGTQTLGPEIHGEARSIGALVTLLDLIGCAERPALILLDDGQWADEPTLRLLERWREHATTSRHVLVVVAARSEDRQRIDTFQGLRTMPRIALSPFTGEDVRQQIGSMAGTLPEEVVAVIIRHAGGNPFLVAALLHGLIENGALTSSLSSWHVDSHALAELQASARVANILALRITKTSTEARDLLRMGALLGRTFDPALAGALSNIEPRDAVRIVEGYRGSLVWASDSGRFTFLHDKIREALLAEISPTERRRLHRLAAETISATAPERVFELSYHFDAADESVLALPHAMAAATQARARFALELAERQYRIAVRGLDGASQEVRFEATKGLGEVLTLRTQFDEAAEQFQTALAAAPDARARADVEERWGRLELTRGNLLAACAHHETALRHVDRWVPRSKASCTLAAAWELAVQVLHTHLPSLFVGRRKLEGAETELFALELYHILNAPYFFSKGLVWALWAHLRHLNLSERYPPHFQRGRAYAIHASVLSGTPKLFPRAIKLTKQGADLCGEHGDLWGQAEAMAFHGISLHFASRFAESLIALRGAVAQFDRTGDRWEAHTALCFVGITYYRMGDLRRAFEETQHLVKRGREIGDVHALAWALDTWSRVTDGQVPEELVRNELERSREHLQTSLIVTQAEGLRLLGAGRTAEAAALFEAAIQRVRKELGFFHDHNLSLLIYRVMALRRLIEETPPYDPRTRDQLLKRAHRAAKEALAKARKFRNNLPHALRESALVEALRGRPRHARAHVDESITIAEALAMRYEAAQSRQVRGELGELFQWEGAAQEKARAQQELHSIRGAIPTRPDGRAAPITLSLIDRFATVLEAGRKIATALHPETVFAELRHAALALLRAESCLIIERTTDQLRSIHGDAAAPFSRALVEQALQLGHPVVYSSEDVSETDHVLRRASVRSAMCAPLSVGDRMFGGLYVTHGEVGDLFGPEEQRIAQFLAALAGAALENAEGFEEVESRVEERTAQLADANRELTSNLMRLREAQEQLVQAGKLAAVGTLIAGLSHELNNPVGIILGYVQGLLAQMPEPARTQDALRVIERQTLRCSKLVRALLDFARKKPEVREPILPAVLIQNVMALARANAQSKNVQVEAVVDDEIPAVAMCAQEIESALLNLLSNALDATPVGGAVTLAVSRAKRTGSWLEFAIRDSGTGIPADVLPHIFDPFFTTKSLGLGTGLGLSLTRQIVLAHDGQIDVETQEGRGTTMRIWLPAALANTGMS